MKCPYCDKELTIDTLVNPNWINKNDTVLEMECQAYCSECWRRFSFIEVYHKIEEKELDEW